MNLTWWLNSDDPVAMLRLVGQRCSDRKLRHFACACFRQVWRVFGDGLPQRQDRHILRLMELYADGAVGGRKLTRAIPHAGWGRSPDGALWFGNNRWSHSGVQLALEAINGARGHIDPLPGHVVAGLLRDVVAPGPGAETGPPSRAWSGGLVEAMAKAIYENRPLAGGALDSQHLMVLADAAEEMGCLDQALLDHLRGAGPHVRGCWALDLVLGKE